MERFMAKVRQDTDGHWQWTGTITRGYGRFTMGGRASHVQAHRAAWMLFRGPIPDGLQIHHVCAVRSCVNPDHLEPVTPQANLAERDQRRVRKAVCKHGHPMEGDNIAWTTKANGYRARYCRECARINSRAMYAKHAEARRTYAREKYRGQHVNTSVWTVAR